MTRRGIYATGLLLTFVSKLERELPLVQELTMSRHDYDRRQYCDAAMGQPELGASISVQTRLATPLTPCSMMSANFPWASTSTIRA